jgi:GDPmannose 4,6-dehydratase
MSRTVIVTGATGQDGFYLTQRLLNEGTIVHAVVRQAGAAAALASISGTSRLTVHAFDIREATKLRSLVRDVRPDEVFNLAGVSSVAASFERPEETWQSNADVVFVLLDAIRLTAPEAVLYQASSSEMYSSVGGVEVLVDEQTQLAPVSPYGAAKAAAHLLCGAYRTGFGLRVACGILFNHESSRRGSKFLTRKIADYLSEVSGLPATERAQHEPLHVGDLAARRDWGHAPEYVDGILRIARQTQYRAAIIGDSRSDDGFRDYVLATGKASCVWELINCAFELAGMPLSWDRTAPDSFDWDARYADLGTLAVVGDPSLRRSADPGALVGNAERAAIELGWRASRDLGVLMSDLLFSAHGT